MPSNTDADIGNSTFLYTARIIRIFAFSLTDSLTSLIVGMVVGTLAILVLLVLTHYYRLSIKKYIRTHIWPSVPTPDIFVLFSNDGEKNGNAHPISKNNNNSISRTELAEFRSAFNEIPAADVEIPDDVREFKQMMKHDKGEDDRNPASVSDVDFSISPSAENASSSLPSLRSYTLSTGEFSARANSSRWIHPSLQSNQSSTSTRRPQSYAGNSANSFQDASYLREARRLYSDGTAARQHDTIETQPITYAKIALEPKDNSKFSQAANDFSQNGLSQNASSELQAANESSLFLSPFFTQNSNQGSDDQMRCLGSTAPYVVVPEMNEAPCKEPSNQHLRSIDQNTERFQPLHTNTNGENRILNYESCPSEKMFNLNLKELSNRLSPAENQTVINGSTQQANNILLDVDPASYIQEKESYLTINEALHGQDVALCATSEPQRSLNEDFAFQDLRSSSFKLNDEDEVSSSLAMDDVMTRLLSHESNDDSEIDHDERTEIEDESAYVTEAQTAKLC